MSQVMNSLETLMSEMLIFSCGRVTRETTSRDGSFVKLVLFEYDCHCILFKVWASFVYHPEREGRETDKYDITIWHYELVSN